MKYVEILKLVGIKGRKLCGVDDPEACAAFLFAVNDDFTTICSSWEYIDGLRFYCINLYDCIHPVKLTHDSFMQIYNRLPIRCEEDLDHNLMMEVDFEGRVNAHIKFRGMLNAYIKVDDDIRGKLVVEIEEYVAKKLCKDNL